ncbi:DNA helicase PcrA [Dellaglioa carnosa]|uniref:ATP-dependent DNA helicase n=1 Tax=Dellaglioa carnosa TaxID=2995136 RepID=A0ABT4JMF5_9LACO|nr:DNA helicase PcrA [Dellaglioa carnosa]MCZ2491534.1 DNA helicase PcrA [Dellaglioa carnosa]MCZ2494611.1 DNA helicase PcrA [Dellaglioa carnosa]MDK1731474.1 DNA helicase PcrA [Dellaglioa carnosa]
MTTESLLNGMNNKQKEAVLQTEGPLLIMAGAGSGKTRVLTHRVAYLIEEKGVNPWNVLAITFTNKASKEMRERVNKLLDKGAEDVWVSTFHALCVRILRRDIDQIGYNRAFSITDTGEQTTLVKRILREQNIDPQKFTPRSFLGAISNAKNDLLTETEYAERAASMFEQMVAKVYTAYQRELRSNQAVDFDDLIMLTIRLFKEKSETLTFYQNKFQYIHVDEYQDTNEAQYTLVNMLAERFKNLCVVGDADQSIYGWRGANMDNIMNFEKDYPNAAVVKLEQNYRSTKTILDAANSVIGNNTNRSDKSLWTDNKAGEKISYYRGQSENDESHYVVEKIQEQIKENHLNYGDFAILYRTNAQSRVIEETFLKSNVPYKMVGGHKFYERLEIRDILGYIRLIANDQDSMSFDRVVNVPKRGIGASSVDKLREFSEMNNWTMLEGAENSALANISGKAGKSLQEFAVMIRGLQKMREFLNVTELTKEILKQSGYEASLKKTKTIENETRLENVEEFLSVTQQFDDRWEAEEDDSDRYVDFLADLALVSAQDDIAEEPEEVTLMTLHAAKGLEFPVVFLMGLEEGIFPLSRAMLEDDELEEERRLAYVGITRAERKLYLTNAYSRMLYGRRQSNQASRFIGEIDDSLLELDNQMAAPSSGRSSFSNQRATATTYRRPAKTIERDNGTGADSVVWRIGEKVEHKAWGTGTIVKVSGSGSDAELDIAFKEQGIKRLLTAFAPITKKVD